MFPIPHMSSSSSPSSKIFRRWVGRISPKPFKNRSIWSLTRDTNRQRMTRLNGIRFVIYYLFDWTQLSNDFCFSFFIGWSMIGNKLFFLVVVSRQAFISSLVMKLDLNGQLSSRLRDYSICNNARMVGTCFDSKNPSLTITYHQNSNSLWQQLGSFSQIPSRYLYGKIKNVNSCLFQGYFAIGCPSSFLIFRNQKSFGM